ncbi:hypothetical protein M378DRAFT_332385 [Amanita muscaria Koide BX008]|uniref:Uncharacterized protein n=1 Tax=Amanita muscaria (strain Koide BX008) TaxID=946122 RepID=A0A0C2WZC6_AMAMK|nr:hypothetical protein M378DRAFT_332385 [Amanita muscaria Koide BX008]
MRPSSSRWRASRSLAALLNRSALAQGPRLEFRVCDMVDDVGKHRCPRFLPAFTGGARRKRWTRNTRATSRVIATSPPRALPTITPIFDDEPCGVGVVLAVELVVEGKATLVDADAFCSKSTLNI